MFCCRNDQQQKDEECSQSVFPSDIHVFFYFVDKQAVFIEFVHNFSENMDRISEAL